MKQFIKFFIALAAMTVSTTSAWGDDKVVTYLWYVGGTSPFNETSDPAQQFTSESDDLSGTYYVEGTVTIDRTLWLSGNTNLILCDDSELKINDSDSYGIYSDDYNLTIYAQSSGSHSGKLTINSDVDGISGNGDVTINGGIISVTSSSGDGIDCEYFTFNGGNVDIVASKASSDGISANCAVTINGGTLSATVARFGIYSENGYDVSINGGKVTATGGIAGIWSTRYINLGWTNAEDYIECSSYNKNPTAVSGKVFDIEGGGTFGGGRGGEVRGQH